MRERTRFPAEVLERLTGLRLLVSTGPANAAIDVAAACRHGITVCGTVLVNTSRGPAVDEAALVGVLSEGRIRAAAIDVFDTGPLPADHQLRSLPNALLTGHVAYVTRGLYTIFYQDAVEDIAAYQAGSPIRLMA
jgi:phosphoglycerate dehydrogenase-like enzyme